MWIIKKYHKKLEYTKYEVIIIRSQKPASWGGQIKIIKIKTNNVNFGLITSIANMVKIMVSGSLTISSSIDKKECWISKTSEVILAIVSPFLFSE